MKYIKYFEELNPKYKFINEKGYLTITALIDDEEEGWLTFHKCNKNTIKIDDLSVNTHKGGLGTKLMEFGLNYIKTKFTNINLITLDASPSGFNIPLPKLIEFYQRFGFEISKMNIKNAIMIKHLN